MWTFNCARVYVGDYTYGHSDLMRQFDTSSYTKCQYEIIEGSITTKKLRPVKVRGVDYEGEYTYHTLETFVLYPLTEITIVRISNRKGNHLLKLVKHKQGTKSTMYKMRI